MKERLDFIDNMRFPLIVGVVLDHASVSMPQCVRGDDAASMAFAILQVIVKISVPVFFVISGFLFFKDTESFGLEKYIQKLRSRLHTLVIPYILWILICLLYLTLKQASAILQAKNLEAVSGLYTWNIFWTYSDGFPLHVPLWYIRDLIVMCICSPLIWLLMSKMKHLGILVMISLYLLHHIDGSISLPISTFYFTLGAYIAISRVNISNIGNRMKWLTLIVMPLAILCSVQDSHIPIRRLGDIAFATSYMVLSAFITERYKVKMPQKLTESVFFVYSAHTIMIVSACTMIFSIVIHDNAMPTLLFIRLFLIGISATAICVGIYHLIKKITPKTISLITGQR